MREACEWINMDYQSVCRLRKAIIESWRICKGYKWTTTDEKLLNLKQEKNKKGEII